MDVSKLERSVRLLISDIRRYHPDEFHDSERKIIGELLYTLEAIIFGWRHGERRQIENSLQDIRTTLAEMEERLERNSAVCQFSKNKPFNFPEFISVRVDSSNGVISPDPERFLKKINNIVRSGSVTVIVDPYILSAADEGNSAVDVLQEVTEITKNSKWVYLFCRGDRIDVSTIANMRNKLGIKLKGIFTGDIHDRYVFVGHDENMANSYHRPWIPGETNKSNPELKYWRGAAFGASINGVTKRPTYILNFFGEDLDSLFAYLDVTMVELK